MTILSKEERESIIQEASKRILLSLPEVIGNLITNHTAQIEINQKFYKKYPRFKKHKDCVISIVEQTEAKHPHLSHEEVLEKSVSKIDKRIEQIKNLDIGNINTNPNRQFDSIEPAKIEHKDHGEL